MTFAGPSALFPQVLAVRHQDLQILDQQTLDPGPLRVSATLCKAPGASKTHAAAATSSSAGITPALPAIVYHHHRRQHQQPAGQGHLLTRQPSLPRSMNHQGVPAARWPSLPHLSSSAKQRLASWSASGHSSVDMRAAWKPLECAPGTIDNERHTLVDDCVRRHMSQML